MAKRLAPTKSQATSTQSLLKESVEFPFAGLIGIDSSKGLAITGNDHELYYRCLSIFSKTQRHFSEEFHAAQRDADPETFTRAAHTLKGAAGSIGATATQQTAEHLEVLCKQHGAPDDLEAALQRVATELDPVIAGLDRFIADYEKSSGEDSGNNIVAQVKLDLPQIRGRAELLIILHQDILPLAKEITNLFVIANVRQLSDHLALLARRHQLKALLLSAEILRDAAEYFDIAAINQHISELEDVIGLISEDNGGM